MKSEYEIQVSPIWTSENNAAFIHPKYVSPVEFRVRNRPFLTSPLVFGHTNLFTLTQQADHLFDVVDSFDPISPLVQAFYFNVSSLSDSENKQTCTVKTLHSFGEINPSERPVLDQENRRKSHTQFETICDVCSLDIVKDRDRPRGQYFDAQVKVNFEMSLDGHSGEFISTLLNSTVLTASESSLQIEPIGFDLIVIRENLTASRLELLRRIHVHSRTNTTTSRRC